MKNNIFYFKKLLLLSLILIGACKKESPIPEPKADIYIAGYTLDENYTHFVATYWKNGEAFPVNGATETRANDILISNGKVIMAGISDEMPCLWIDNIKYDLSQNGMYNGEVSKLIMQGNELYLCGTAAIGADIKKHAMLWKFNLLNMTAATNVLSQNESLACDLTVNGNDIYIIGADSDHPGYWKNSANSFIKLSDYQGLGTGIKFSENKLIAVGIGDEGNWGIWKSGEAFEPIGFKKDEGFINGINYETKDHLFLSGFIGIANSNNETACYWLNNKKIDLSQLSDADDLAINGAYTYIAGSAPRGAIIFNAGYWRNGKWNSLTEKPSRALSIFILPK